jgi:hypothetical protein
MKVAVMRLPSGVERVILLRRLHTCEEEGLRTVAKIAHVGLAYMSRMPMATGDAFNDLRTYIQTGTRKPAIRCCQRWVCELLPAGPTSAFNHDGRAP